MKKIVKSYMKTYQEAQELPKEWNIFCKDNFFMNTDILSFIQKVNNCKQKYYMVYNKNDELESCFIMFPFKYEFSKKIKLNVQLIFLPISVADPGIVSKNNSQVLSECLKQIKGIKLILSTDEDFSLLNGVRYKGLPNCVMKIKWKNIEEYMNSMRYRYRHNIEKILKSRESLTIRVLENNSQFTKEMYNLYLQVMNKVDYVLEVLSFEFFQNNFSKTIVIEANNEPKAFLQVIEDGERVIGEFCGFDYKYRDEYNLYHNLVFAFFEYAINNKFKIADIGQSAEGIKLKFGADLENKYSWIFYNGNKVINFFLKKILLSKSTERKTFDYNVFKKEK